MGVMLTRYPELFGAIVSQVPLLDMRRYHQLLAGASWMAEYGDPDEPADWTYISKYSPYQNVHSGRNYPPTLFAPRPGTTASTPPTPGRWWPGCLNRGTTSATTNIEGGHGAAADNEQLAFKWALVFEFLWEQLTK